MAVDGYLNFDTKINLKGFQRDTNKISSGLKGLKNQLGGIATAAAAAFSIKQIISFASSCKEAYLVQLEAETRLEQVMKNTMGATRDQIQAVKDYASELQKVGVIGDEITLSGLQELGTYVENADSLKTMSVVLDDMLAQQYGLNATAENAVTISTMLGKVLEGQTSALSRYGYSFTDAQEQLLKYGTEEQKVATLAEVVEASVGGMNEALAKTPAGRLKQISNNMGDVKEQFGKAVVNIQALFLPSLERLSNGLARIADLAVRVSEALANVFGISIDNSAAVSSNISASVEAQEDLTEAVKETNKAQKNSLAGFDKINTLASNTADTAAESSLGGRSAAVELDETPAEKKLDKLAEKLKELAEPIRLAWDSNEEQLTDELQRALTSVKGLVSGIGSSLEEVWTNGSGERYAGNILTLFKDVFGVVGDISEALKKAWDSKGTALVQSYADRWNSLLELWHSVIDSFRGAWNEDDTGESILEHIIGIITQYNNIFKNLRTSIKEAWEENEVGERIFSTILEFIDTIAGIAERAFKATADWAEDVDFYPLMESVEKLLEALSPMGEHIGEGLLWFYKNVILPFAGWVIEDALPASIDVLASAISACDKIITAFKPAGKWLWEKFLKPFGKVAGNGIVDGMKMIAEGYDALGEAVDERSDIWDTIKEAGSLQSFNRGWGADLMRSWGLDGVANFLEKSDKFFSLMDRSPLFDKWNDFWQGMGEKIFDVQLALAKFKDKWTDFWGGFGETVEENHEIIVSVWGGIKEWFSEKWEGIKEIFSGVGDFFKDTFTGAKDNVTVAWESVTGWFSNIWDTIKEKFSNVGSWFKERFEKARDNIKNAWSKIGEWFSKRREDIENAFSNVGTWFKERFEAARNNVKGAFENIGTWFGDRWNDIKSKFEGVGEWFRDRFQAARDAVERVFKNIGGFFSGLWNDITNGLTEGINWAIDKINGLLTRLENGINDVTSAISSAMSIHIPDNVPVIGGTNFDLNIPSVNIPEIPRLAQGTVIPANYGNFLSILGDNKRETEVVSPLSTIKEALVEALAGIGYGNQPIHVHVDLDGREIGRVAVKAVNSDNARKGR